MVTSHSKVQAATAHTSGLDELIAKYTLPSIQPDDITVARMRARSGWSDKKCRRILRGDGYTVCVRVLDERGKSVTAYRKP